MKSDINEILNKFDSEGAVIERLKLPKEGITLEGEFQLSPLAKLSEKEQLFVAAFVCCHGSIKSMEKHFGVSYPTIKSWLRDLAEKLNFVDIETSEEARPTSVIDQLASGEIDVNQALNELKK